MISGLSGLGPINDMSPFKILNNCGSSSNLHFLIKLPTGVILESFLEASLATPSFSASTRILLNFIILNSRLFIVHLTCLYRTGPPSYIFTAIAVISIKGELRTISTRASTISMILFINLCSTLIE